jgi:hypothetical protein
MGFLYIVETLHAVGNPGSGIGFDTPFFAVFAAAACHT